MEQTNLYLALGSLLFVALILASAVRRYQEVMAERRMRIKRVLRGVDLLQDLFYRISGCPLPMELEKVLRQDILARFQKVKQIDARYREIDRMIEDAEQAANQVVENQRFGIQDKLQLNKITQALGEMIGFLRNGTLLSPLSAEQARRYSELVGIRRSECVYRYHIEQAKSLHEENRVHEALGHCNSIKTFLKEHGPSSDQVKGWYDEAEELRKALSEPGDSSAPAA